MRSRSAKARRRQATPARWPTRLRVLLACRPRGSAPGQNRLSSSLCGSKELEVLSVEEDHSVAIVDDVEHVAHASGPGEREDAPRTRPGALELLHDGIIRVDVAEGLAVEVLDVAEDLRALRRRRRNLRPGNPLIGRNGAPRAVVRVVSGARRGSQAGIGLARRLTVVVAVCDGRAALMRRQSSARSAAEATLPLPRKACRGARNGPSPSLPSVARVPQLLRHAIRPYG